MAEKRSDREIKEIIQSRITVEDMRKRELHEINDYDLLVEIVKTLPYEGEKAIPTYDGATLYLTEKIKKWAKRRVKNGFGELVKKGIVKKIKPEDPKQRDAIKYGVSDKHYSNQIDFYVTDHEIIFFDSLVTEELSEEGMMEDEGTVEEGSNNQEIGRETTEEVIEQPTLPSTILSRGDKILIDPHIEKFPTCEDDKRKRDVLLDIKYEIDINNSPFYKHDALMERLFYLMLLEHYTIAYTLFLELYERAFRNRDHKWLSGRTTVMDGIDLRRRLYWHMIYAFTVSKGLKNSKFYIQRVFNVISEYEDIPENWLMDILKNLKEHRRDEEHPLEEDMCLKILRENVHRPNNIRFIQDCLNQQLEEGDQEHTVEVGFSEENIRSLLAYYEDTHHLS